MNLNEQQLHELQEMAGLFFSIEEIACNLEVDSEELSEQVRSESGEIYQAYMKGILTTKVQLRRAILQSALNGSSPAQQMMKEFETKSRP